MRRDDSIVMQVKCRQDCGRVSIYRFFHDGSYRALADACLHHKLFPCRQVIRAEHDSKLGTARRSV